MTATQTATQTATLTEAQRNDPRALRRLIRAGGFPHPTAGLAPGYVQCNLAILPAADAADFAAYCAANPQVAPVLATSEPGDPHLPALGDDLDLRTDLGSYQVFRDGQAQAAPDVSDAWRQDLVAFAFGCSFSFEEALLREGVALRYLDRGDREALYLSDLETVASGPFAGRIILSMRPLRPADAIRAIGVTATYPGVHGEPLHIGLPEAIGVDLDKPFDTLGTTRVLEDELPVFWACGVTPQLAIRDARLPFAITHTSAHMLITDLCLEDMARR
jgi:uncharacterized protein YcsI (UPF0317 family)